MSEESYKPLAFFFFVCLVILSVLKFSTNYEKGVTMSEEPKKISCPNCLGEAMKEGNKIICETCDAIFTYTKTGGAKVKEIGRLDNIEKRLDQHDNLLQGLIPEPEPEPKTDDEPEETSLLGD